VEECGPGENHGEFTGVVGVVQPTVMFQVPRMEATREPNDLVPCFPPHPANMGRQGLNDWDTTERHCDKV